MILRYKWLEIHIVVIGRMIVLFWNIDAFVDKYEYKIDEEDGDEKAVVFDAPKRKLVIDKREEEWRNAGTKSGGKKVTKRQPTFATEDKS